MSARTECLSFLSFFCCVKFNTGSCGLRVAARRVCTCVALDVMEDFLPPPNCRGGVRSPHASDDWWCFMLGAWAVPQRIIQARVLWTTVSLVVMGRTLPSSNCVDEAQNPCCPWWSMLLPMIDDTRNSSRPYRSMFEVWTCLSVMIQGACPLYCGYARCDANTSTSPLTAEVKFEILAASGDWWWLWFLGAFTVSWLASKLASA